jgi:NADH-quinone oxidoreductase subunit C
MTVLERLTQTFPDALHGTALDGKAFVYVLPEDLPETCRRIRDELGFGRFVDLTCADFPERPDRFDVHVLLYSMSEHLWLRVKTRTEGSLPTLTGLWEGANWYERELFDLFGIHVEGHPDLTRILTPDDWSFHPLRRDEPLGSIPIDFTVTRELYDT